MLKFFAKIIKKNLLKFFADLFNIAIIKKINVFIKILFTNFYIMQFIFNFNFNLNIDYKFCNWIYVKVNIILFENTISTKNYFDIEIKFILIN